MPPPKGAAPRLAGSAGPVITPLRLGLEKMKLELIVAQRFVVKLQQLLLEAQERIFSLSNVVLSGSPERFGWVGCGPDLNY